MQVRSTSIGVGCTVSSDRLDFSKLSKARRARHDEGAAVPEQDTPDVGAPTDASAQGAPHTSGVRPGSGAEGSQGRSIPRLNFNKLREPASSVESTPGTDRVADNAHQDATHSASPGADIVEQSSPGVDASLNRSQGSQHRVDDQVRPGGEQGSERGSGDSKQGNGGGTAQGKSHTLGASQPTKHAGHDAESTTASPDQSTQNKSDQGVTTQNHTQLNRQEQTSRPDARVAHQQANHAENSAVKGAASLPKTKNSGIATENVPRGGGPAQGESHTLGAPEQGGGQERDAVSSAGAQGGREQSGENAYQGESSRGDHGVDTGGGDDRHEYIDASMVEDDGEHENAAEDDSAPFTGFDSMFEDLMSDDEDAFVEQVQRTPRQSRRASRDRTPGSVDSDESLVSGGHSGAGASGGGIVNPFIDDLDEAADGFAQGGEDGAGESLVGGNPYLDAVVERAGHRHRARDQFPEEYEKREATKVQNNPKRDAGYQKFQQEVAEWEAEQGVERREEPEHTTVHRQFARTYDQYPVSEVVVNERGVPQDYAERVEQSESRHTKFKYFSQDKRMNTAEMTFFRETRERKSAALKSVELAERLLPPIGKQESEKDFRARARRITRALEGRGAYKKGARATFGLKEQDTLRFLAMFRYATPSHIARMFSEPRATTVNRLNKLRSHGLIINRAIFGTEDLWILTDAGMLLSGLELVRTTDARMTFSMFPHQFTVNNTAAHLWGAGVNVLGDEEYPRYNKTNLRGEPIPGEQLVSELEIQSTFTKQRAFGAAHIFRPQIIGQINTAFDKWEDAGGVGFGQSPEMHQGNEYMWTLLPPTVHRHAYHVPDLVVKRDRNPDGSPNSLAVEIEIYNKPQESYDRTLRAYAADTRLYKQVVWVCKGVGSAKKLEKAAKKTGLLQEDRIRIVPILTEDGVFRGRDLWLI